MTIRDELVQTVLKWEKKFGFIPGQSGITTAVSEYDDQNNLEIIWI